MTAAEVVVAPDPDALADRVAAWLVARIAAAAAAAAPFRIALSGGSTPVKLFERLATAPIDWAHVELYWCDERFVPRNKPENNAWLARTHFIDRVSIPAGAVHAIPVDGTPETAAARYAALLERAAAARPGQPLFDVCLLGMGDDGHTASLFPGDAALAVTRDLAVAVHGRRPEPRVTLTLPALANAGAVVFLVTGAAKRPLVARALAGDHALPAGRVRSDGELVWFVTADAAP